ncbi:hypothetical protein ACJ5M8_000955 [Vibrio antiquarius]
MGNETPALSSEITEQLQRQFDSGKPATSIHYPLSATSLVIPAIKKTVSHNSAPERHIKMTDHKNHYKSIVYKAMIAAYNYAFHDKFAPINAQSVYSKNVPNFINWLNNATIDNHYKLLKEYESYRFDELSNHGGRSALNGLKPIFTYACEHSIELESLLSQHELRYLAKLRQTKISPNNNRSQESLASYFGKFDWLRREDVGIGNDLYTTLASPKMTVSSLIQTTSVLLLEIYRHKQRLKQFLIDKEIDVASFESNTYGKLNDHKKCLAVGELAYSLLSAFNRDGNEGDKALMELVILSLASSKDSFLSMQSVLGSQEACDALFLSQKGTVSVRRVVSLVSINPQGALFSAQIMFQLASQKDLPAITEIESLMFTWLMACQTVQPTDIAKLTKNSFRKVVVGQRVTHIECEYFKGRAKAVHQTRSLSVRTVEGKAVLSYITQHNGGKLNSHKTASKVYNSLASRAGSLAKLLQLDHINLAVEKAHKNSGDIPLIIPNALIKLIENMDLQRENASSTNKSFQTHLFGLRAIKNSAVHAYSDPYTLHFLINRNSHSNQTEKQHYLNNDNEEWINSSGRITREVMFDLINNVFDLDFEGLTEIELEKAQEAFNEELTALTDTVSYKKEEMVARLRVVTGQEKGQVNEIGVLSYSTQQENQGLAPIYVLDSPVTAWRLYNYLYEFKAHYKQLLSVNPDHLFKSVLPTVEWMQFTLNKLSKESRKQGQALHKKMIESGTTVSVFHSI